MLTDTFINLCCSVLLDDNPKFSLSVTRDIDQIFDFYGEEEIPLHFKTKYQLVKTIIKLKNDRIVGESIIDNVLTTGHFKEFESYLNTIIKRKIEPEKIDTAINQIAQRKQYVSLLRDMPKIDGFIKQFNNQSFTDIKTALGGWSDLIASLHSRVLEEKRKETSTTIKELDLFSDNYTNILNSIENSYTGKNAVSTGYDELDIHMNGGFEPSRLYIFGGSSGDGKSTLLLNFIRNAVETNKNLEGPPIIIPYYTLENLVDESLVRLYCCITKQDTKTLMRKYASERTLIEEFLKDWQLKHNAIVYIKYFPPTLTSVSDLYSSNELIKTKYANRGILRGTYVDYLDILKSGQTFDLHRLEQGQIAIDMKVSAVLQSIPYVTLSQLNRSGYDQKEMPTLVTMSESIKKVEHSDFVGIIRSILEGAGEDDDIKSRLHQGNGIGDMMISIGKNRSGAKNVTANLKVNFPQFRIEGKDRFTTVLFDPPVRTESAFV